jgi:hypothetical protein
MTLAEEFRSRNFSKFFLALIGLLAGTVVKSLVVNVTVAFLGIYGQWFVPYSFLSISSGRGCRTPLSLSVARGG